MSIHLWEVDHPYYCEEGNYYGGGNHYKYSTWQEFTAEMGSADENLNLVFRWDWDEEDGETGESNFNGDDYYRNGRLKLFYMGQRKAKAYSCEVQVCRADEPAVLAFLRDKWRHMQVLWEPISKPAEGDTP